jgi:membrane protein
LTAQPPKERQCRRNLRRRTGRSTSRAALNSRATSNFAARRSLAVDVAPNTPLQIPWVGWKDIFWRTYSEMNSDRLLSIAGGVAFFILFAIFPAITALVSAYGLFFNASAIPQNLSLMNDVVPADVLGILREQVVRIASQSNGALSVGVIAGILVTMWSAMGGAKAMIDALNVVYEEEEGRSFFSLNLVALLFTLGGFAVFLLATGAVVVLPLALSRVGLGDLTAALLRILRWARASGRVACRACRALPLRAVSP